MSVARASGEPSTRANARSVPESDGGGSPGAAIASAEDASFVYDASLNYKAAGIPLVVLAMLAEAASTFA